MEKHYNASVMTNSSNQPFSEKAAVYNHLVPVPLTDDQLEVLKHGRKAVVSLLDWKFNFACIIVAERGLIEYCNS